MSTSLNTSIEPQFRTIERLKIRFAESEQGDDHALLLSPWPETLHAFDQMWDRLAEHAHLVAVDLPGFGHSERRDSLLAPRAMGEFVIRLADEFGLEHPHAVGPDIGTGALLFAAADNPGRLRSIVLGSGGASFPLELGGILVHRFDRCTDRRPRTLEPLRQAMQTVGIRWRRTDLDRRTLSVEQMEVETLATEIQTGVQH
jgi:pimeloyl-ACP methyl ester carboxylesterase